MALMEEQLPDAVELMVRSLARGASVFQLAVGIVAKEVPDRWAPNSASSPMRPPMAATFAEA
jgi:Flp pilus assembly protein TadB